MDLTLNDAAAILGVHPKSLQRLAQQGKLRGVYKVGGYAWRWRKDAFEAMRHGKAAA